MTKKIFAIIVTYNGIKWAAKCFNSLKQSEVLLNIIVVDNASIDGTVEYIEALHPDVHLIRSKINIGFAKANNIGIKYALEHGADYFFLINQDAWIESNTIKELLDSFQNNDEVGIVSPMHLAADKNALEKDFSLIFTSRARIDVFSDLFMRRFKPEYETTFINASAWMLNRRCVEKIGGFNTLLFTHYGEDDNYCQRVLFHGLKILVNTKATICHDSEKSEKNHKKIVFKEVNRYKSEKIRLGDINIDDMIVMSDCKLHLKLIKLAIIKNYFIFRFARIKELIEDYKLFSQDIQISRQNDKRGFNIWL